MTSPTDAGPADGRRATTRPHPTPSLFRRDEVPNHVWGDADGGFVTDRVICSTDQLHVLEFEIPAGRGFGHTAQNPTLFAADVAYMCQSGTLVLADPSTGEVALAPAGSGLHFGRDTWHHGFAHGDRSVRVLEFMAPPPSRGTASTYGRTKPLLTAEAVRYRDDRWARRWPQALDEQRAARRLTPLDETSALLSLRDANPGHLVATLLDTPYLTVRRGTVQPGTVDSFCRLDAECVIVVERGELWVDARVPVADPVAGSVAAVGDSAATPEQAPVAQPYWVHSLRPGDACFLPAGTDLRMLVRADQPAGYLQGLGRVPQGWTP